MQYDDFFVDIEGIRVIEWQSEQHNYSYYPIILEGKYKGKAKRLNDFLKANNIFARRYFYPLLNKLNYLNAEFSLNCDELDLPVASNISENILCLPIYPDLSKEEVNYILSIIKKAFKDFL